ncbi:MAG: hypothetical protein M3R13_11970 [Armatimonadota bacterium]|nr:hypothetical protein [Armatimonadota bacterium]
MNAWQAENLRILIRHMDTRPVERLDMSSINKCGAPACAMGHALTVVALRERGLNGELSEEAVRFFGLGDDASIGWGRLFGASLRVQGAQVDFLHNPTPQEWATEARKVLTENGYSMDDGFAAFKAKILAPLEEVKQ